MWIQSNLYQFIVADHDFKIIETNYRPSRPIIQVQVSIIEPYGYLWPRDCLGSMVVGWQLLQDAFGFSQGPDGQEHQGSTDHRGLGDLFHRNWAIYSYLWLSMAIYGYLWLSGNPGYLPCKKKKDVDLSHQNKNWTQKTGRFDHQNKGFNP